MSSVTSARQALCDFLYYAYLPSRGRAEDRAAWWGRLLTDPDVPGFSTAAEARDLLARIVSDLVADAPRVKIGVTSGYDSRGVLGALVSVLPPDRIVAFTRGQPGNPDFDKAQRFTRDVLSAHHLLPTQKSEFVTDDVVLGASMHPGGGPRVIGASTKGLATEIGDFSSLPNLSGYLGDALSGKHLSGAVRGDFEAARERFLRTNRPFIPADLLPEFFPRGYDPGHVLPSRPMLPVALMDPQDQLDFHYRQFQRIRLSAGQYDEAEMAAMAPHARARARRQMRRSRAPYTDPRWQKSWMLVPFQDRLEQRFYKRFLAESYPTIFPDLCAALAKAAPRPPAPPPPLRRLRASLGRLIRRARPTAPVPPPATSADLRARSARRTHTNWELLYEQNEQFRSEYCDPLLRSLAARRGLWFDPLRVHELAQEGAYGYGTVLWGLLSMETAIRAGRLPEPE